MWVVMTLYQSLRSNVLNIRQFFARPTLWGAVVLFSLAVAGCGPAPLGTGWPAISVLKNVCGGKSSESILVSYNDRIVQVNPADGKAVVLKNADCQDRPPDSDGKLRAWDFRPTGNKQFYTNPLPLDDQKLLAISYDQHIYTIDETLAQATVAEGRTVDGYTGHAVTDMVASADFIYVALNAKDVVASYALQWDYLNPLHKGNSGAFDYWSGLWGGFLNAPK